MQADNLGLDAMLALKIPVGARELTVRELLAQWAGAGNPAYAGHDAEAQARLCRVFVRGGIEALRAAQAPLAPDAWLQFGLQPGRPAQRAGMYARLSALSQSLLHDGRIRNFFFMHKDPGLRVRFELGPCERSSLVASIRAELDAGAAEGEIQEITPAVYEPETWLFGGPSSMEHVHRLFTHDASMWLQFHALAHGDPELAATSWALSLRVVRALLVGLRIVDWEDIDVWDRVRSRTGRRLPAETLGEEAFASVSEELRAAWLDPTRLRAVLPERLEALASATASAIADAAACWREQYLTSAEAHVGARAGAALFIIFHWNRAGLSPTRQALLAESLCRRPTV